MIVSPISSVLDSFRRFLLQIGGANIAGADRAFKPAYFVVARRQKACPLAPPQHGGGRDPGNKRAFRGAVFAVALSRPVFDRGRVSG